MIDPALLTRARDGDPALPIVLTTGYSGEQAGGSPLDLEWPVLRKPFRGDQLAAALRQALESRREPQEA